MELVPGRGRRPAQIESLSQPSEGSPPSALERLALAHERFQAIRDQRADRAAFLGGDHPGFAEKFRIEFERNVCLHGGLDIVRANVTTWTAR